MKKEALSSTFEWFEKFYGGKYCKVGGAGYAASGALTITVTGAGSSSGYIFTVGDVFKNIRTGENMVVETVASSTTITVASADRSYGSSVAAAGVSGDELFIIGNVSAEGSGARNVNTTLATVETNYTQIFKTSIAVTGTAKESAMYGGSDLLIERAVKGTEHMEQIEKAFWLGEKNLDTAGHATRATGGINELLVGGNSFVQNQGGVLTAPDFNNFLREGFTYGSPKKILFAGGLVLAAVNEFARGQINTKVGESSYGVKVSSYMTAFGDITMVHNPLFIGELAGYGYLLDLECFKIRPLRNRDTRLELNVQAPDVDAEIDQYITETGLERRQAPRHALLKGVSQS